MISWGTREPPLFFAPGYSSIDVLHSQNGERNVHLRVETPFISLAPHLLQNPPPCLVKKSDTSTPSHPKKRFSFHSDGGAFGLGICPEHHSQHTETSPLELTFVALFNSRRKLSNHLISVNITPPFKELVELVNVTAEESHGMEVTCIFQPPIHRLGHVGSDVSEPTSWKMRASPF